MITETEKLVITGRSKNISYNSETVGQWPTWPIDLSCLSGYILSPDKVTADVYDERDLFHTWIIMEYSVDQILVPVHILFIFMIERKKKILVPRIQRAGNFWICLKSNFPHPG